MKYFSEEDEKRFWSRVFKRDDGCWIWNSKGNDGYGAFKVKRRQMRAHAASWRIAFGDIPDGKQINHHCDNPSCVNPAHLYCGTQAENMADKTARGRNATGLKNGSHTRPDRRPKGSRVGGAKLEEADIPFIRHWTSKFNDVEVANAFGITNANVGMIKHGKTWTHVA